jgi:hypothetical protein
MPRKVRLNWAEQKARRTRYSKVFELGNGQSLELYSNSTSAYITAVSRNVMKDCPVVIGPIDLPRDQWLILAETAAKIADLLKTGRSKRDKGYRLDPELY